MDADPLALRAPAVARRPRPRSEAALLRAVQAGDEAALAELFRRHWPDAHRAAWLITHDAQGAEDVAQEAFLAALRGIAAFDRRRPFAPWLHRIVVNRAIDHTRRRAARREVATEAVPEEAAPPAAPGLDDGIVRALAQLGPEQRAVVVLRHLLGYGPGEVAALLGLPRGTVNSRLRRALDALGDALEEE